MRAHRACLFLLALACGSSRGGQGSPDGGTADAADGSPLADAKGRPDGNGTTDAPADAAPLPRDPCVEAGTCPPGKWINVTPASMDPAVLSPTANAFGPGAVVADPARPSDLYVGGGAAGIWRSTDYGSTWKQIESTIPGGPIGVPFAVAGTTPATIWVSAAKGDGTIMKSTNGGTSFVAMGGGQVADLYSIEVDPYDSTHLVSGLHEADGVLESVDGGKTWHSASGAGWPTGGISWFSFFVDTGAAATTRKTWVAIAQDGASVVRTEDGGATWTTPSGIAGLQHPHGCSRLHQAGGDLFLAGIYGTGQGVYRSTDLGRTWSRVDSGGAPEAVVFGGSKHLYAMWGWACSDCSFESTLETAALPGTTWTTAPVPDGIGPNSVAVVNDGTHDVFVGVMWASGIWRYVE